jgi:integrase
MATERERGTGGLIKYSNSDYWYAQWYENGKQVRQSLKTKSKQEARAKLNRIIQARDAGLMPSLAHKRLTYGDLRDGLILDYQNRGRKSLFVLKDGNETITGLEALDGFFDRKRRAISISTDDCEKFISERRKDGISNAYINRSLSALRRMFKLAVQKRKLSAAPHISFLKEPPARKGFITRAQFEQIVDGFPPKVLPLALLLFYTGVRLGEGTQIDWRQVNLDTGLILLEGDQTKNEDPRYLPMPSILIDVLKKVEPKTGFAFPDTNFTKIWRAACVKAGLGKWRDPEDHGKGYDGLIIHDLRRSAIKQLVESGASESVAMKISGHRSTNVFRRYNIVTTDDVVHAMKNVEGFGKNEPSLSRLSLSEKKE